MTRTRLLAALVMAPVAIAAILLLPTEWMMALADIPAPDLFIRTGGDTRISNFLLWQLAYTELWFTETLWPDVDAATLRQALDDYAMRERRFGLTGAQVSASFPPPPAGTDE